MKSTVPK